MFYYYYIIITIHFFISSILLCVLCVRLRNKYNNIGYRKPGWVKSLRLSFFGHLARTAPEEDHHRVIAATLRPSRAEWRRPVGRPRTTWLRTIDDDFQSLNFRVHTAWRKARNRDIWHQVVSTATLHSEVRQ